MDHLADTLLDTIYNMGSATSDDLQYALDQIREILRKLPRPNPILGPILSTLEDAIAQAEPFD